MVAGAHFFIQDKTGKSIAVEPVDGTLKVHDAPLGVMTSAPFFLCLAGTAAEGCLLSPRSACMC